MTKRRLSKHQKHRIRQRQKQQLDELDKSEENSSQPVPPENGVTGTVICNFGQQLEVEVADADGRIKRFRCFQRSNLPPLVTGDRVLIQPNEDDTSVIVALADRQSVFSRPNAAGELKPVAANLDLVMIVVAPRPQPFLNLLDRYLVSVESLNLSALIVVNKFDLQEQNPEPVISTLQSLYPRIGYGVECVSALTGAGIGPLKAALAGRTTVIVGQSGVGKSSLINALDAAEHTLVGDMSGNDEKGTHTTTAARLFHLDGFDLIDSPGIREFHLGDLSAEGLLDGFIEFRPYLGRCRFRDCRHRDEPGCAILKAVKSGEIPAQRLDSYFHLLNTLPAS